MMEEFGMDQEQVESHYSKLARVSIFQILWSLEKVESKAKSVQREEEDGDAPSMLSSAQEDEADHLSRKKLDSSEDIESEDFLDMVLWKRRPQDHTFLCVLDKRTQKPFTLGSGTRTCKDAYNDSELDHVVFRFPSLGIQEAKLELGKISASTLILRDGKWVHRLESFGGLDKVNEAFSWAAKAEAGKCGVSETKRPDVRAIRITATCSARLKIAAQHETLVLWPLLELSGPVG